MGACSGSSSSSFGHRGNPPSPSRLVVCSSAPAQLVNSGSVSSTPRRFRRVLFFSLRSAWISRFPTGILNLSGYERGLAG
ncbi:hypothetical protein AGIG_G20175 [Arapaima gigas]